MRIPQLLLGLVIASALLLAAAVSIPEPPGAHGIRHPEHPSMWVGGDGAARSDGLLVIGWAFGAVQLAFFAACFALGLRRPEGLGPLRRPLWIGLVLYEALWTLLFFSYAGFLDDPAGLVGSLPRPTAWMVYGLWPFPLFFALLYLRHFDGWVLDEAGLERFRARLDALRREDAEPD